MVLFYYLYFLKHYEWLSFIFYFIINFFSHNYFLYYIFQHFTCVKELAYISNTILKIIMQLVYYNIATSILTSNILIFFFKVRTPIYFLFYKRTLSYSHNIVKKPFFSNLLYDIKFLDFNYWSKHSISSQLGSISFILQSIFFFEINTRLNTYFFSNYSPFFFTYSKHNLLASFSNYDSIHSYLFRMQMIKFCYYEKKKYADVSWKYIIMDYYSLLFFLALRKFLQFNESTYISDSSIRFFKKEVSLGVFFSTYKKTALPFSNTNNSSAPFLYKYKFFTSSLLLKLIIKFNVYMRSLKNLVAIHKTNIIISVSNYYAFNITFFKAILDLHSFFIIDTCIDKHLYYILNVTINSFTTSLWMKVVNFFLETTFHFLKIKKFSKKLSLHRRFSSTNFFKEWYWLLVNKYDNTNLFISYYTSTQYHNSLPKLLTKNFNKYTVNLYYVKSSFIFFYTFFYKPFYTYSYSTSCFYNNKQINYFYKPNFCFILPLSINTFSTVISFRFYYRYNFFYYSWYYIATDFFELTSSDLFVYQFEFLDSIYMYIMLFSMYAQSITNVLNRAIHKNIMNTVISHVPTPAFSDSYFCNKHALIYHFVFTILIEVLDKDMYRFLYIDYVQLGTQIRGIKSECQEFAYYSRIERKFANKKVRELKKLKKKTADRYVLLDPFLIHESDCFLLMNMSILNYCTYYLWVFFLKKTTFTVRLLLCYTALIKKSIVNLPTDFFLLRSIGSTFFGYYINLKFTLYKQHYLLDSSLWLYALYIIQYILAFNLLSYVLLTNTLYSFKSFTYFNLIYFSNIKKTNYTNKSSLNFISNIVVPTFFNKTCYIYDHLSESNYFLKISKKSFYKIWGVERLARTFYRYCYVNNFLTSFIKKRIYRKPKKFRYVKKKYIPKKKKSKKKKTLFFFSKSMLFLFYNYAALHTFRNNNNSFIHYYSKIWTYIKNFYGCMPFFNNTVCRSSSFSICRSVLFHSLYSNYYKHKKINLFLCTTSLYKTQLSLKLSFKKSIINNTFLNIVCRIAALSTYIQKDTYAYLIYYKLLFRLYDCFCTYSYTKKVQHSTSIVINVSIIDTYYSTLHFIHNEETDFFFFTNSLTKQIKENMKSVFYLNYLELLKDLIVFYRFFILKLISIKLYNKKTKKFTQLIVDTFFMYNLKYSTFYSTIFIYLYTSNKYLSYILSLLDTVYKYWVPTMLTHVISSYFTIEIYTMRSSITLSTNCLLLTLLNRFSNYIKFFLLSYIKSNKETFSAFYIVSTFLHTVFIKINTYHFLIKACIKLATLGLQISFFYMYKVHLVYLAIQRLAVLISDSTKYLSFFYVNLLSYRPRYAARHLRKKILKELNFFKLCTSELLIKHILYIIYLLKFFNI